MTELDDEAFFEKFVDAFQVAGDFFLRLQHFLDFLHGHFFRSDGHGFFELEAHVHFRGYSGDGGYGAPENGTEAGRERVRSEVESLFSDTYGPVFNDAGEVVATQ